MYSFAKFDQRVESVKQRWMGWLLVAGPPEHIVLSCLGSSAAKATGVALERGGAGGEPKVPLVHHSLYHGTSSRVVQVVLLVHHPAASCVRLNRVYN